MGRRRTTQDNSDTPEGGLTPQQRASVDLLASGHTLTDAAEAIGVGRPAVSDWLNHYGVAGVISGKFSVREMATKSPLVARHDYI